MKSIKSLYLHLSNLVKDNLLDQDLTPSFKHLALWADQPSFPEFGANNYPAIFFSFSSPGVEYVGQLSLMADIQIRIYVAYVSYLDNHDESYNQEGSLDFLELLERLFVLLHGYQSDQAGTLYFEGMQAMDLETNVLLYSMTFRTKLIEEGALQNKEEADATSSEDNVQISRAPGSAMPLPETEMSDLDQQIC